MKNKIVLMLWSQHKSLMLLTDSQIGAIYLLNEPKDRFEPYQTIGPKLESLSSFSASNKEGEFGTALATKNIQHVSDIPDDTHVIFSTVGGDFRAKDIITIPIVIGSDVVSIISLASIKSYSSASLRLVNSLFNEMAARLGTVMASQKIIEYSQKLENTNIELLQQARELEVQADELSAQNTELEMQKSELDEANRLKSNFLSNMSHELRTPLNSVIALTGVLSRRLAGHIPQEEYSYLEIIERNGKNLLSLINDVLDISRIEAGREEIEITSFNANSVIADVAAMLQTHAQHQGIELIHESKDAVVTIVSDADKFRHILQNLVGNAVKFTEKGMVSVTAQQREDTLQVTVADTGIGISPDVLPYIFDEFRQADGSTSRRFGGTGLGLAIAMKYANLLGGTISVKSVLDKGSQFTLTLPLLFPQDSGFVEEDHSQQRISAPIIPMPRQEDTAPGKTILLVEDNESASIQVRDLIEEMGCQVQVAHDGGEALCIIESTVPDAMILDLMMPGIDGFKVLETVRNAKDTAHVPVLILTAKHITKEELKFLKRNNIHQLIQKGDVDRKHLQSAVYGMLFPDAAENKQTQREGKPIKGKPVILVVEDNPDNMITLKALLADHHTILAASDAQQGIELAKKHLPNLILMDIALPDISGIDAYKAIKKNPKLQQTPVIALTASAMLHDRETILSHGFDAFIAKPIIAKEFFKVISEVLYGK